MAKAPPSFQFYPADWLVGTRHLPRAARGTYIDLLALIWSKKIVKLDCIRLSRCLGITPDEFQEDWEEIKENFTISDDGGIINDRLESIREQVEQRSRRLSKAGKKGNKSRHEGEGADMLPPGERKNSADMLPPGERKNSADMLSPGERKNSADMLPPGERKNSADMLPPGDSMSTEDRRLKTEDRRLNTEDNTGRRAPSTAKNKQPTEPALFTEFWSVYPARNGRKVGKNKALRLFKGLTEDEQRQAVEAVENYAAATRAGRYARDPERFLRDRFWCDYLSPAVPEPVLSDRTRRTLSAAQRVLEKAKGGEACSTTRLLSKPSR